MKRPTPENGGDVTLRRIRPEDAEEVSALVIRTLRTVSVRDYSEEYIEDLVQRMRPEDMRKRAEQTHFYVACRGGAIVGCGAIGPYWDRADESCLFTFFVLPEHEGQGIGRRIMETLEEDEYFLRAERIEIPPSACSFPQGIYVSFFLETDDLYAVRPDQLAAVRSYLKEHGLRPVSDTTAYLYRTTFSDTGYCFQFCVRVRVEREEP